MQILLTAHFKKQLKVLTKKYLHVKEDLYIKLISFNPENEIYIGKSIYKTRIKSSDIPKGKSGSFRAYIYLYRSKNSLIPLHIYTKSVKSFLTDQELEHHLRVTLSELTQNN